jgi:regulator of replication initiation timing
LPVITDREQPTNKEQILLARIKQLEKQLAKFQAENTHLKLENKHLKTLVQQDQETETKIIQSPPLKVKR